MTMTMTRAMRQVYIVAAKRTPFGTFGGTLKDLTATQLCVESSRAALRAGSIDPSLVDSVFVGNVLQTADDAAYMARHVQLQSNIPKDKPALTLNRLCGSGFQSVISGVHDVMLGEAHVSLCGGSENMSQAPLSAWGHHARFGTQLGAGLNLTDTLWSGLTDKHTNTPMGITAENLAIQYHITREEADAWAHRSQTLWANAEKAGYFNAEMAPIEIKLKKGTTTKTKIMSSDEHPRQVTMDKMATLPPVFQKNGTVTAANASGICDGAGTIIVASEEAVKQHDLKPMSRIVSYGIAGVEPTIMGIGPVPAIQQALKRANLSLNDMDRIEINEAFASQFIACERELGLNRDIVNTNGGAIALGHPLAASGSRIMAHLAHDLVRLGKKYAVGAACIGGGQGIAIVIENVS